MSGSRLGVGGRALPRCGSTRASHGAASSVSRSSSSSSSPSPWSCKGGGEAGGWIGPGWRPWARIGTLSRSSTASMRDLSQRWIRAFGGPSDGGMTPPGAPGYKTRRSRLSHDAYRR
ncbi:MAG TPA: hypothetical protein ENK18_12415 [Deltaproteobacteria bacterium]|nr:hypothetical protein [Deltaproteobacteria bacterium]